MLWSSRACSLRLVAADARRTAPTWRWGVWVRSPGFSRPRSQPAKAGTPNRPAPARFMDSFDVQFWSRIGAMNVARLSKVEVGQAMAADSTLESRATCRFMEIRKGGGWESVRLLTSAPTACRLSKDEDRGELQAPRTKRRCIAWVFWGLGLGISLDLGSWNLELPRVRAHDVLLLCAVRQDSVAARV